MWTARAIPLTLLLLSSCTSNDPDAGETTAPTTTASTTGPSTASTNDPGETTPTTGAASEVGTTGEATTGEAMTGDVTTDAGETTSTGTTSTSDGTGESSTGTPVDLLPWTYIAAVDEGIRDDDYGGGSFQAPRNGYAHSGIDFYMPVGTPLRSPCDGVYLADYDGGYGEWVQVVCPVPATLAGEATVYASLLFAHLDVPEVAATGIDPGAAGVVTRGQALGTSGKSGNAGAQGINPHLHLEIALHASELAGLSEAHASGDDADTPAAGLLRAEMQARCLDPTGFTPTQASLALGRRIDPFMFLTCLVGDKPALGAPVGQPLHAWSDDYTAIDFDVDVGQ